MAKKNPFIISGRIPDEYFCDREIESGELIKKIEGQASNILLMAERRIGKTGLIDYCYRRENIAENFYVFYFDILHTSSFQEFVYEFGKEVYNRLIPRGQRMIQSISLAIRSLNPKFTFDPVTGMPNFTLEVGSVSDPEFTLDEIFAWLEHADKPCVVAIDEFQRIGKYKQQNIEALLRGKIQRLANCHFIFSGSEPHLLSEMFQKKNRAFYGSTDTMLLGPIDIDKYRNFTKHFFTDADLGLDDDTFDSLYRYFDGNTFCIQKILHETYSSIEAGDKCSREILQQSLRSILSNNGNGYREMLSRLTTKQKAVLTAIALEGKASKISSAAFLRKHHLESASMVQTALRVLIEDEWVSEHEKVYRLSDQFFTLWLQQQNGFEKMF